MALIECPDCKKSISDLAQTCINCGRPIKSSDTAPKEAPTPSFQEKIYKLKNAKFNVQKNVKSEESTKSIEKVLNLCDWLATFLAGQNFLVRTILIVVSGLIFTILIDSVLPQSDFQALKGEASCAQIFMSLYVPIVLIWVQFKLWNSSGKKKPNSSTLKTKIVESENTLFSAQSEVEKNKLRSLGFTDFDIAMFLICKGDSSECRYAIFLEGGFFTPVKNYENNESTICRLSLSDLMDRFKPQTVKTYEKAPNNLSHEILRMRVDISFNTLCEECMSYDFCFWVHHGKKYSNSSNGDFLQIEMEQ